MPVVFAPQNQNSYYSNSSRSAGAGNVADSAMADIAAYKAQNAAGEFNAQSQQQANIVGAQLQAHAAMQERAAELEIQGWMQRQAFTQSDQQELVRQQNALSKLQTDLDNGDITQTEFYKMLPKIAPRVNYLTFKEQHTNNQMLQQQRQARADLLNEQKQHQQLHDSYLNGELDSQTETLIPADQKLYMAKYMSMAHPDIPPDSPEYNGMMQMEAAQMGRGITGIRGKNGFTPLAALFPKGSGVPIPGASGAPSGTGSSGSRGGGGTLTENQHIQHVEKADEMTQKWAKAQETPPTPDQLKAHYDEIMGKFEAARQKFQEATPEGRHARAMQEQKTDVSAADAHMQGLMQRNDIPVAARNEAVNTMRRIRDIAKEYGSLDSLAPALRKQVDKLKDKYERLTRGFPALAPTTGPRVEIQPAQSLADVIRSNVRGGLSSLGDTLSQASLGGDFVTGGGN